LQLLRIFGAKIIVYSLVLGVTSMYVPCMEGRTMHASCMEGGDSCMHHAWMGEPCMFHGWNGRRVYVSCMYHACIHEWDTL